MYYVYYLIDPRDNTVFYVGKGSKNRINWHEWQIKNNKKITSSFAKFNRISEILESGHEVTKIKVFETDDEALAYSKEIEHIKLIGIENLTNVVIDRGQTPISELVSNGLKRSSKYKKFVEYLRSPEGKEESRIKNLGERNPMFGKKLSDSHKEALLAGASRPKSDEHKAKIGKAHRGKEKSTEHCKNISESLRHSEVFKAAVTSTEYREKQRINSSGANNPRAKTYKFTSPNGEDFFITGEFDLFCKTNNLSRNAMSKIARGLVNHTSHRGWSVVEIKKQS